MIFNEIYSAYYNTVAKIIAAVIDGKTDDKTLGSIVAEHAFGESVLTVLPSIKSEKWQIIKGDMTTPIKHRPTMPLTLIQKRWLKAILLDPRIKLFGTQIEGLEDIEPLFTEEDYVIYDKYSDGDPYDDENYIENFRTLLGAIRAGQSVRLEMINRRGNAVYLKCRPIGIEYSEKDDKFRLKSSGNPFIKTVNIARITKCRIYEGDFSEDTLPAESDTKTITLKVSEERNTLERCMLHFAHFEKRAERDDGHYLLHLNYQKDDETELVIRVLSFGPLVEVLEPDDFKALIIERLKSQKACKLV